MGLSSMRYRILLFLVLTGVALAAVPGSALCSTTTWFKTYGVDADLAWSSPSIRATNDGGHIVSATAQSPDGRGMDALVVKIDRRGEVQWQATYGGAADDHVRIIRQTADGGYIAAGETSSFDPAGSSDAWVFRLDATGALLWQKTVGGGNHESIAWIEQTTDGGYIAAVDSIYSFAYLQSLVKFSQDGSVEWQRTFGQDKTMGTRTVLQTADGNFVIEGRTYIGTGWNVKLMKVDAAGSILWERYYERRTDFADTHVLPTSDGGFALAVDGYLSDAGTYDIWFAKLDSEGAIQWQKAYGAPGYDIPRSLIQTDDGGYAVAGVNQVLKIGPAGDLQWYKTVKGLGDVVFTSAANARGGGITLTGVIFGTTARSLTAVTLDGNGNVAGCPGELIIDYPGQAADYTFGYRTSYYSIGTGDPAYMVRDSSAVRGTGMAGPATAICAANDSVPPVLDVNVDPAVLWPPNHKPVNVTVSGTASDDDSGIDTVTVTVVDEYGVDIPAAAGLPATFALEASRRGDDRDGRSYVITVTATDLAGNAAERTITVLVPHDQGH